MPKIPKANGHALLVDAGPGSGHRNEFTGSSFQSSLGAGPLAQLRAAAIASRSACLSIAAWWIRVLTRKAGVPPNPNAFA